MELYSSKPGLARTNSAAPVLPTHLAQFLLRNTPVRIASSSSVGRAPCPIVLGESIRCPTLSAVTRPWTRKHREARGEQSPLARVHLPLALAVASSPGGELRWEAPRSRETPHKAPGEASVLRRSTSLHGDSIPQGYRKGPPRRAETSPKPAANGCDNITNRPTCSSGARVSLPAAPAGTSSLSGRAPPQGDRPLARREPRQ